MLQNRYTATYTLEDGASTDRRIVEQIITTVETMHEEGEAIEFLGAKQTIGADGRVEEVTVRFAAPTKGTVGRLNVRGDLPASGTPLRQ